MMPVRPLLLLFVCALFSSSVSAETVLLIEFVENQHTVVRVFRPAEPTETRHQKAVTTSKAGSVKVLLKGPDYSESWYIDDPKYVSVPVSEDGRHEHVRLREGSYILRIPRSLKEYVSLSLEFEDGSVEYVTMDLSKEPESR